VGASRPVGRRLPPRPSRKKRVKVRFVPAEGREHSTRQGGDRSSKLKGQGTTLVATSTPRSSRLFSGVEAYLSTLGSMSLNSGSFTIEDRDGATCRQRRRIETTRAVLSQGQARRNDPSARNELGFDRRPKLTFPRRLDGPRTGRRLDRDPPVDSSPSPGRGLTATAGRVHAARAHLPLRPQFRGRGLRRPANPG